MSILSEFEKRLPDDCVPSFDLFELQPTYSST